MNFGYMLRFAVISVGVGLGTAIGCGGANSSELLDNVGPGGDGGGNPPLPDGTVGVDSGQGRDTGTDADEPEEDSGQPPPLGTRCYNDGTARYCTGGQPVCCIERFIGKTYTCISSGGNCQPADNRWSVRCDSNDDCRQGRCCGHLRDGHFDQIRCEQTDRCGQDTRQVCSTDDDCRDGDHCTGTDPENEIYHFCE